MVACEKDSAAEFTDRVVGFSSSIVSDHDHVPAGSVRVDTVVRAGGLREIGWVISVAAEKTVDV